MSDSSKRFKNAMDGASRYTTTVLEEFRTGEIPDSLRRDFRETYDFYLSDEERLKMAKMGRIQRSLFSSYYMIRSLFLRLSPARRLVVIIAFFMAWTGFSGDGDETFLGFLIMFFVLGLELKDKTMARDELQEGRAVQLAIMPSSAPEVPGWEIWFHSTPANDVGGDLVDHMALGEHRLAVTLGDVAGKGLAAALMAAKLQATIRAIAPDEDNLSERAGKLNRILRRDGVPNRFISMIHCDVSTDSGEIHYVNAGHHPPLLIHEDGLSELQRGDAAIGLSPDTTFKGHDVQLGENDLFVIYSDGVTEARNEIGRFYSDERFLDLVRHCHGMSAASLGERIIESVSTFVQGGPQSDDLSLVILRRLP